MCCFCDDRMVVNIPGGTDASQGMENPSLCHIKSTCSGACKRKISPFLVIFMCVYMLFGIRSDGENCGLDFVYFHPIIRRLEMVLLS